VALNEPVLVILRALGLGDLLTAVPSLRAIADAFPEHHRVLATTAGLVDLARHTGTVDEVVAVEPLGPLPGPLHDAVVAINLHGRGPQSHRVLLESHPRRLIAFANDTLAVAGPRWRPDEHEVSRWCRLLTESGVCADPARLELDRPDPASDRTSGATLIHPGAASPARCWPVERWAEVAAGEAAAGHVVAITGSAAEADSCRQVAEAAGLPATACLAGTMDTSGLAAAVAGAGLVLCADTGVAHLATAFGRPSVILFGPVPPSEWGPPPDRVRHVALWVGRRGDPHGDRVDRGLLAISVADVFDAIHGLRVATVGSGRFA
jgi:ADP-heptose:LPS heptosyltransferase